jgi:hypothetical protein
VAIYEKRMEIRVPLRNVGSGLGLLLAPELHTAALDLARSVTSTTLTSAVPPGEITDMIFDLRFADSAADFLRQLHEVREFTVIARCRDMNGEQEIRTEATIIYSSTAKREGPTYSDAWSFGEVKLFHGENTKPFAELPRSRTVTVTTGAGVMGSASDEIEEPGGSDAGEGSPSE